MRSQTDHVVQRKYTVKEGSTRVDDKKCHLMCVYFFIIIDRPSLMDGSHPPFRNVRAACPRALTFTWISRFGVPETIISDLGPQFTSSLWLQLCEMLNISHKQTTAYHPESNGTVERLHRCLKNALRAHAAAATWSEELPFVILGLRAQPREDTGLSPAEAVFGAQIVLPNEFLQNDELSVDTIAKHFSKTLHVSAPSLPRHKSNTYLPSELPAELLSAPLIWVHRGGLVPPLQLLYNGPYTVLCRGPAPSPSESGRGTRWSPSAALRLAQLRMPPLAACVTAADRRARTQAVLLQPSGYPFQTTSFFAFSFLGAAT
jgi:transposase InsO family protein